MRKALIVGINDYPDGNELTGCIPDANKMCNILQKDFDDTPNFSCKKLISSEGEINISNLTENIIELFSYDCDVALFYFSGHGSEQTNKSKACLVTQDATEHREGVELDFLVDLANKHPNAREVVIILDCCYSGTVGNSFSLNNIASLREGVSILASSHRSQVSFDTTNGGIFTSIVFDALDGGAADTIGQVTVAGIYSFADKLLGVWDQRPIFKSYVSKMISLRKCKPLVPFNILRKLPAYFKTADEEFKLDPTFEPEAEPKGHDNEKIFADLQKFRGAALVYPIGEEHMYFAAINSKSCALTPLGKYYWQLAKDEKI
jgi:hypothetical protein